MLPAMLLATMVHFVVEVSAILKNLYPTNPAAVDDELAEGFAPWLAQHFWDSEAMVKIMAVTAFILSSTG